MKISTDAWLRLVNAAKDSDAPITNAEVVSALADARPNVRRIGQHVAEQRGIQLVDVSVNAAREAVE